MNLPIPDQQRDIAIPRGNATNGWLIFARGASLVTLNTEAGMSDLCRAHFDGPVPKIEARDGKLTIQYGRLSLAEWARLALLWGRNAATIVLNADVPWRIGIRSGLSKLTADLRAIRLTEILVSGGASEVLIQLPKPVGNVPLRITGGVNNLTLRYPQNSAVSVRVRGGANKVAFDDQYFGSVGGGLRLATANYAQTEDRYEIEVVGGASKLTVEAASNS